MKPAHMSVAVNYYPLSASDPKFNNPRTFSIEVYVANPACPTEWLCVASLLDVNAVKSFRADPLQPLAFYAGSKWIEVMPLLGTLHSITTCVRCDLDFRPTIKGSKVCDDCWGDDPT